MNGAEKAKLNEHNSKIALVRLMAVKPATPAALLGALKWLLLDV